MDGELGGGATLKIRNAGTRKMDGGDLAARVWPPELENLSPARDILAPELNEHPLGSERIQQAVNDAVESAPAEGELHPSCNLSFE